MVCCCSIIPLFRFQHIKASKPAGLVIESVNRILQQLTLTMLTAAKTWKTRSFSS